MASIKIGKKQLFLILALAIFVILISIATRQTNSRRAAMRQIVSDTTTRSQVGATPNSDALLRPNQAGLPEFQTPAQIVSNKVSEFGRNRRELLFAMASKFGLQVDPQIQEFYNAVEANDRPNIVRLSQTLFERAKKEDDIRRLFPPILETIGVTEVAQNWDPEKLLAYGNAVLDSLRPGMVYIGGSDPGRFIPTLLNETADGERHIVLTQNGLADSTYRDYVKFLYGDQVSLWDETESKKAFDEYMADAQKRLEHDINFPNEPKQLYPGETVENGKIERGNSIQAIMDINERLLTRLLEKNPDLRFAMQESFSMGGSYSSATPLGPILELRADSQLTPETANKSLDYFRKLVSQNPSGETDAHKAYAHLAVAQGNLFANRNLPNQAEQAYRLALQFWPNSPEAKSQLQAQQQKLIARP